MSRLVCDILKADAAVLGDILRDRGVEIDTVVTSPPYWRKRRYGHDPSELGREKDPAEYVQRLADILSSLPVKKSGSLWINVDDVRDPKTCGLLRIPARFAEAMVDRGWLLADHVIWAKAGMDLEDGRFGRCMMESVRWRLNDNGMEPIMRFTRSSRAWTDLAAIGCLRASMEESSHRRYLPSYLMQTPTDVEGSLRPNVMRVKATNSRIAHFAAFPLAVAEIPIAMTCPMQVCRICGTPRSRRTVQTGIEGSLESRGWGKYEAATDLELQAAGALRRKLNGPNGRRPWHERRPVTIEWSDCGHGDFVGGVVCDPFGGTATVAEVALKLGRSSVVGDLYEKYLDIGRRRCEMTQGWLDQNGLDPWRLAR